MAFPGEGCGSIRKRIAAPGKKDTGAIVSINMSFLQCNDGGSPCQNSSYNHWSVLRQAAGSNGLVAQFV